MKLSDLTKTVEQMTDEELLERLRQIRHNRETVRPVAKRYVAKAEKKTSRKKVSKVESLIGLLSPEERDALLKQLEQQGD